VEGWAGACVAGVPGVGARGGAGGVTEIPGAPGALGRTTWGGGARIQPAAPPIAASSTAIQKSGQKRDPPLRCTGRGDRRPKRRSFGVNTSVRSSGSNGEPAPSGGVTDGWRSVPGTGRRLVDRPGAGPTRPT